ncbi:LLM class F420-dependent oxidoreductase [SAR202 cluster bacterium AD-804-J14_MRT_500m]|nr:LLM class F420-dependent oxidoreductase [SAR202 cluster bacterium AD-804-J14_MRT_500m]
MELGAVFPQTQIGTDPGAASEYAQAAEDLGYDYLVVFDHVLGVNTTHHVGWKGFYDKDDQFHETFVLLGYLSGVTQNIGLSTAIVILPQRQTALVAKQATEIDILSGNRLRLGIGVGWNHVEYEALGKNFHNRGQRYDEQIRVLRDLWSKESVNCEGKWHSLSHTGINPLPNNRNIPLWLGTLPPSPEKVLKRIGVKADGWIHTTRGVNPDDQFHRTLENIRTFAQNAGRDPMEVGVECFVVAFEHHPEDWAQAALNWEEAGATHVSFYTLRSGYTSLDQHIKAIRRLKEDLS